VADAPWRCSECGTVNEPVANACRTCGRWPSLFDLESSTLEQPAQSEPEPEDAYAARTVDVAEADPEVEEPEAFEPDEPELPPEFETDEDEGPVPKPVWQRFARLIVPIGVVLYILISALANRG
jgi:hypothetical protein